MDKQQTLELVRSQLLAGVVTREEVASLLGVPVQLAPQVPFVVAGVAQERVESRSSSLVRLLYIIGALILLTGVAILVGQNWQEIGFVGRLLVSVGIATLGYVGGVVLRTPEQRTLSQILLTVSAILAPLGAYVLIAEAHIELSTRLSAGVATMLLVLFLLAGVWVRRTVLVLISAVYATWAYYSLLADLLLRISTSGDLLLKWGTVLLGIAYLFLGYAVAESLGDESDQTEKSTVSRILYAAGTVAVLGVLITFDAPWDVLFALFVFLFMYLSVFLKSRTVLTLAAFFLVANIFTLTSRYFFDSLGWSISLIGAGAVVIGVGYGTYQVNKKYIAV